jgi:hypothetical protein
MIEAPQFFVPAATPDNQDSIYSELARWSNGVVPNESGRIYSISYEHDGEEWTATVGASLRGVRHVSKRSKSKKIERTEHLADPAVVLAIFPGRPFIVVTNHQIDESLRIGSRWANPFYVGTPKSITYFAPPL